MVFKHCLLFEKLFKRMLVLFIMKQTRSTGGIVVNSKGQILIVNNKEKISTWGFPKGHVKGREADLTTAKREIYEETGVGDLEYGKKLGTYKRQSTYDSSDIKNITMFLFRTKQVKLNPTDPRTAKVKWVDKNKVTDILTHEEDKNFYLKFIDEL